MGCAAYSGAKEGSPPAPYDTRMIRAAIFDLGSTLIRRTDLELERVKCVALASHAASRWGCRDPDTFAARLLEIRLAGWKRSEAEQVEVPAPPGWRWRGPSRALRIVAGQSRIRLASERG